MDKHAPASERRPSRALLWIIAAAAMFWLLREAYAVLMPAVTALLLALAVWPLVAAIRARLPRRLEWLGAVAGALVVVALLAFFLVGIGIAARSIYSLARDIGPGLGKRLGELPFTLPDAFGGGGDPGAQAMKLSGDLASTALAGLNATASTLGGIVLILFLMLLMLGEAPNWNAKLEAISRGRRDARRWVDIGRSVGAKFRAYFTIRLVLGAASGLLYGGFLFAIGVDYALLWGLLAVLLGFIPTVGSIISGILPTIYVFIARDAGAALLVGAGLLVIEQVMGNFIDPKVTGRRLAVSPLVVLLALAVWTTLWGIAGALLAVPLTVLATVVMAHFEQLKPAALLLTDRDDFDGLEDYRSPD
jgi:AI-2 transport protein TqsA